MATTQFKVALNAANYPVTYRQASRAILQQGEDIAPRTNSAFYGTQDSADYNVIQLTFCENVIPIPKGLQSVGFLEEYPPYSSPVTDFDQLMLVRSSIGSNVSFSPARGKNYVYSSANAGWISYNAFVLDPLRKNVTYGYVNGRTLIFYESTKLVEWNPSVPSVDTLTLTLPAGFDISDIKGNSAASNYHLLYTDIDILWSTITDVLDFADTDLGAGRQIPIDLRGRITSVRPISGGFMIYTSENVIAASFTNDASRPFAFREVQNSGGVNSGEQVTGEANAAGHYTYGTAGIQLVTLQRAETVFPEAADFLISGELDVWNPATKEVDTDTLSQAMVPKMQYLGNRYLFISYGPGNNPGPDMYTHALVFDTTLQRWGKLKVDHTDINLLPLEALGGPLRYYQLKYEYDYYEMSYQNLVYPADPPPGFRQNYGFLQNDGTVLLMVTDMEALLGGGVVLFGRCQLRRSRLMTLSKTESEGIQLDPAPSITALGSSTGAERTSKTPLTISNQTAAFLETKSRVTAMNFDIAIEGGFQLTTFIVEGLNHATR